MRSFSLSKYLASSLILATTVFAQNSRSFINQEIKTPNWLDINAEGRWRSEGQLDIGFKDNNDQNFILQRLRFGVGIRPASWIYFYGQAQDARAFNAQTTSGGVPTPDVSGQANSLDLRQAWVDIGHESGWWDIKGGRQVLAFGTERLIGGGDWTNNARVFDAVKLGIHHGANRVDIFSSSVVVTQAAGEDHHLEGDNLHGIYGSLGSIIPHAKFEPYLLWRVSPNFNAGPGAAGKYHSWTYGIRTAGTITPAWNYELELAGQNGKVGNQTLNAYIGEAQFRYQFIDKQWKPSILAEFNFASGDRHPNDGRVNTFDQLYPTNHTPYGFVDAIGRRNIKQVKAGYWIQPKSWLLLKAEGHQFWLASKYDGLYAAGGNLTVAPVLTGANSINVGGELDGGAAITLSRHYTVGVQGGHLFAGGYLQQYSPGSGRGFYAVWVDFRL